MESLNTTTEPKIDNRKSGPRLRVEAASAHLKEVHGVEVASATLTKLRSVGGGPPFEKFGRRVLYPVPLLDAWALARLGKPLRHTSERKAA